MRPREERKESVGELCSGAVSEKIVALLMAAERPAGGLEELLDRRVQVGVERVVRSIRVRLLREVRHDGQGPVPFGHRRRRPNVAFRVAAGAMHHEPDRSFRRIEGPTAVHHRDQIVTVSRLERDSSEAGLEQSGIVGPRSGTAIVAAARGLDGGARGAPRTVARDKRQRRRDRGEGERPRVHSAATRLSASGTTVASFSIAGRAVRAIAAAR